MLLSEETQVPGAALPLQALKDQLRLGTGFGDDTLQDALLEAHLRAAIAQIEGRTGKVLLTHRFKLTLRDWRRPESQPLPLAPISTLVSITTYDSANQAQVLDSGRYRLVQDTHRPVVEGVSWLLPTIAEGGRAEVVFDAGFGAAWGAVPADLRQAVLLLAAEFYERRSAGEGASLALPSLIQGLIAPWLTIRTFGGARA